MTSIEKTMQAQMYIDKLANGINPITNLEVPEGECINDVRISRCLFFVSDILNQIVDNNGNKKLPFQISDEQLSRYEFSDDPIPITEIVQRINYLADSPLMKKLTYNNIASYLENYGYLELTTQEDGKSARRPTDKGISLGIVVEERFGKNGVHYVNGYNVEAQRFIIDNFQSILEFNDKEKSTGED